MPDCLFCKIVARELPTEVLAENAHALAFPDIAPQAPTHVLVIPKRHVASLMETSEEDSHLMGQLLILTRQVAEEQGLTAYRAVLNTGAEAGQSVFHMHVHLLAGRPFAWPPG